MSSTMKMYAIILVAIALLIIGCISQQSKVVKVTDGDTIVLEDGTIIRFVGINTPEKGELCYEKAKEYVEKEILLKKVHIIEYGKGKYKRTLAEVYENGKNINIELLKQGLANAYHGDVPNWEEYVRAEKEGFEKNGCMWKMSNISYCVEVEKIGNVFGVRNVCNVTIDTNITIRDTSSSHRFKTRLTLKPYGRITINENCKNDNKTIGLCKHIFNNDGDELIIYNKDGLVAKLNYGQYSYS